MNVAMSLQEIFDKAATHLLTQGCVSVKKGIGCAYRDGTGNSCVAGCFIKDEFYRVELEGGTVAAEKVTKALIDSGVGSESLFFLGILQRSVPDRCFHTGKYQGDSFWHSCSTYLKEIAKNFDLSTEVLER